MMITAYRGDGLRSADQVVTEPMLSDTALLQRARAELDANAHAITEMALQTIPLTGLALGQLASATDAATGALCIGRITGISIEASNTAINTQITLEVAAS